MRAIVSHMKKNAALIVLLVFCFAGCYPAGNGRASKPVFSPPGKSRGNWRLEQKAGVCRLLDATSGYQVWQSNGFCWQLWLQDGRPEALVARTDHFSFGTNVKLLQVEDDGTSETLYDATLAPAYGRGFDQLNRRNTVWSDLTPQADILIYAEPHDPPAEEAYLQLMARHLASKKVWTLGRVPWDLQRLSVDASGETVRLWSRKGGMVRFDIWGAGELSASAEKTEKLPIRTVDSKDLLLLRSWRAKGLIDAELYRRARARLEQP